MAQLQTQTEKHGYGNGIEERGGSLTATSGRWTELVEKMRQSLGLSRNNELTSPTEQSFRK
jgi:hypothetical protein